MKKILCLIGRQLTTENEAYILEYDRPDVQIELYTDAIEMGITFGMLVSLIDSMESGCGKLLFCTDMPQLRDVVQTWYGDRMDEVMLCPFVNYEVVPSMLPYVQYAWNDAKQAFWRVAMKALQQLKGYMAEVEVTDSAIAAVNGRYNRIQKLVETQDEETRQIFYQWLEEYSIALNEADQMFRFYCLTVLLQETKEVRYVEALCHEVCGGGYTVEHCFFVFHQLKRYFLLNPEAQGRAYIEELYEGVRRIWEESCAELTEPVPQEKRDKNRVGVIALQFLGKQHAPTKTAMERIEALNRKMGKEVLVIHSLEQLTKCGELPFWQGMIGNVDHELDGFNRVEGKHGHTFPMYQPIVPMPEYAQVQKILLMLREFAPHKLIVLGNHCLLGDLASRMLPTVCIPMTFSTIPKKQNQFVAIGKHLTENDYAHIKAMGCNPEGYIESTFTFDVIEQATKLSRAELGLPKDKFLLSVVGIRLDYEVTEEFIRGIRKVFEQDCHIVFAGKFEAYEGLCKRVPELAAHSTFVGYQDDILAFEEVCDLYVNPPRVGGGFSVVEAFYKGKPAVTLPYGDVAATSGPEFWVEDLEEMTEMILRYKNDEIFYQKQAERAVQRSAELFDSVGALQHILDEMEKREGFF